MNPQKTSVTISGKEISFETGKIARQANGSVIIRCGDTMVLSTACSSENPLEGVNFLPLRVDYQEKFSSVGKTVSGFIKREGRLSEKEILTSRLIDRPIRPMIQDGFFHEIQLLSYVLSYDGTNAPDVLAICAASAALSLSDIPLVKPIGAVRVGKIEDSFIINPSAEELEESSLDLIIAGTEDAVLMIEGHCQFLTEEQILEAITLGHTAIQSICHCIKEWQATLGKTKKLDTLRIPDQNLISEVEKKAQPLLEKAFDLRDKIERDAALKALSKQLVAELCTEESDFSETDVTETCKAVSSKFMRKKIFDTKSRTDGRGLTEIRPITIEQGILPRTHGSSLFTRGETQSLAICVLGGKQMAQRFENLHGEGNQRFYVQYFFPPFSVGEVGRSGPAGRREIGHGKLAERALSPIMPSQEEFPYVVRLESNITQCNGSSSMASVCGGCLAMMNAGIPIEHPVAGIAMGLLLEKENFVILSDILGIEDALGDMDFKVTGNHEGITAFQMDIKVEGITIDIMQKALSQAKEGRIHILNKMLDACPKSESMSKYAPRIETLQVKPSKIGIVIGPGGKQIRAIIEETGVEIDINDDGLINLSSQSAEQLEKAKAIINGLTAEAEIGKTYAGKIASIVQFGFFVEILPGKEGLCHISEIDTIRIEDLFAYAKEKGLKVGDDFEVVVLDINDRGQLKLSHKSLLKAAQPA